MWVRGEGWTVTIVISSIYINMLKFCLLHTWAVTYPGHERTIKTTITQHREERKGTKHSSKSSVSLTYVLLILNPTNIIIFNMTLLLNLIFFYNAIIFVIEIKLFYTK